MEITLNFSAAQFSHLADLALVFGCQSPEDLLEQLALAAMDSLPPRWQDADENLDFLRQVN